jgi:hypothetical protein
MIVENANYGDESLRRRPADSSTPHSADHFPEPYPRLHRRGLIVVFVGHPPIPVLEQCTRKMGHLTSPICRGYRGTSAEVVWTHPDAERRPGHLRDREFDCSSRECLPLLPDPKSARKEWIVLALLRRTDHEFALTK